jgi:hypothetical protein
MRSPYYDEFELLDSFSAPERQDKNPIRKLRKIPFNEFFYCLMIDKGLAFILNPC